MKNALIEKVTNLDGANLRVDEFRRTRRKRLAVFDISFAIINKGQL